MRLNYYVIISLDKFNIPKGYHCYITQTFATAMFLKLIWNYKFTDYHDKGFVDFQPC